MQPKVKELLDRIHWLIESIGDNPNDIAYQQSAVAQAADLVLEAMRIIEEQTA